MDGHRPVRREQNPAYRPTHRYYRLMLAVGESLSISVRSTTEAWPARSGTDHCDTALVARKLRQIERVEFSPDELTQIVADMNWLAAAGDGWINLIPQIADVEERPTSLGFFTLFGGSGSGVTMCSWIPGSSDSGARVRRSLGVAITWIRSPGRRRAQYTRRPDPGDLDGRTGPPTSLSRDSPSHRGAP